MNKVVIVGNYTLIENEAVEQLYSTIKRFSKISQIVSMPDLHPGIGCAIGCAIKSQDECYPSLIGGDIGCGMTLFKISNSDIGKFKIKRILKRLENVKLSNYDIPRSLLNQYQLPESKFDHDIGTIGGGNHFAEILEVERINDDTIFNDLNLSNNNIFMLVHSGSRTLGQDVASNEILSTRDDIHQYLEKHNYAVKWAKINRIIIAQRLAENLNYELDLILDIVHNYLQQCQTLENPTYIHRKGVGYVKTGELSVIPGSRGSFSYLVKMTDDKELAEKYLNCMAHGAGRRWNRSTAEAHIKAKYKNPADLLTTKLGSAVICHSKSLLYQEAPEAYKNIDDVVQDLVDIGLIKIIAILRPLLTYKA